jgi:hypothetical protein
MANGQTSFIGGASPCGNVIESRNRGSLNSAHIHGTHVPVEEPSMNGLMHRSKQRLYYSNGHFPSLKGVNEVRCCVRHRCRSAACTCINRTPSKINDKMREVLFGATQYKPV